MDIYTVAFKKFAKQYKDDIAALVAYGDVCYSKGNFSRAAEYYIEASNKSWSNSKKRNIDLLNKAAVSFYAIKQFKYAYELLEIASQEAPKNYMLLSNLGGLAIKVGKLEKAVNYLLKSHEINKEYIPTIDGLVSVYGRLGMHDEFHKFGQLSFQLRDKDVFDKKRIAWLKSQLDIKSVVCNKKIPPFNCEDPSRNIIAFSLWGDDEDYTQTAILNAIVAPVLYPGWTARFYCDNTVPNDVINELRSNKAEVIMQKSRGAYYGLFWRFYVISDPNIDRFLIRDCDSVLNCQERVAVDEWLESDKHFHLMRDGITHNELIIAGMWGGVAGVIPNVSSLIDAYYDAKGTEVERTIDQSFLRYCVWPFVKKSHLAHDEIFKFGNARPFPKYGKFPGDKWHVGQNWSVISR